VAEGAQPAPPPVFTSAVSFHGRYVKVGGANFREILKSSGFPPGPALDRCKRKKDGIAVERLTAPTSASTLLYRSACRVTSDTGMLPSRGNKCFFTIKRRCFWVECLYGELTAARV
jgi:hypothetical protein